MEAKIHVSKIEFKPNNTIKAYGILWTKRNDGRISGSNNFDLGWFWYSNNIPKPVTSALNAVVIECKKELMAGKAIPCEWPTNLVDDSPKSTALDLELSDGVFTYTIDKFVIFDPNWNIFNEKDYVIISLHSKIHAKKEIESKVELDNLDDKIARKLFDAFEEYM